MTVPKSSQIFRLLLALAIAIAGIAITLFGSKLRVDEPRSSPAPRFQIPVPRSTWVADMEFSPDGRELVLIEKYGQAPAFEANFFRFPAGDVIRRLGPVAEGACAWSRDGAAFAAPSADGMGVDVWETHAWKLSRKLKVPVGGAEAQVFRQASCSALAFDCEGNLFGVQPPGWGGDATYAMLYVKAWWLDSTNSVEIGEKAAPFDMSVGCVADGTRLAISYDQSPPRVEVWRRRAKKGPRREFTREYQIADSALSKVCLSQDGNTLVVQDKSAVRIYQLHDDHVELIRVLAAELAEEVLLPYVRPVLSKDGRLAAFFSGGKTRNHAASNRPASNRVAVVRLADGAIVFESFRGGAPLALSPDSRFLAVGEKGGINIYSLDVK